MSNINGVTSNKAYQSYEQLQAHEHGPQKNQAPADKPKASAQDTVELGSKDSTEDKSNNYSTYKPDLNFINQLKSAAEEHYNTFRQMAEKLLSSQAYAAQGSWSESYQLWASLQADNDSYSLNYSYSLEFSFQFQFSGKAPVDDDTRAQAAAMLGEDGPFGVKAVSENILNFAKAISGGDSAKIDGLFEAVKKAFGQVASMFGGWDKLPDITRETYDAVKAGFEAWKNEGGLGETAAE